jgi:hypothetical protein
MRRSKQKHAERLRLIVDTLPYETRAAMLEGLEQYDIIAGAYSNRDGGVCPMLAAHRCGGRTDLRSFARAWDHFTGAGRARRASDRELRTLAAQVEASLWKEDQARYAHHADIERLEPTNRPEHDRTKRRVNSSVHPGVPKRSQVSSSPTADEGFGAWMLPFRDLEQYARALEQAMAQVGAARPELYYERPDPDEAPVEPAREELLVS